MSGEGPAGADCVECGRHFSTWVRLAVLCATCDERERQKMVRSYRDFDERDSRRTVMQERLGVSGNNDE